MKKLIVTRHRALIDYLIENDYCTKDTQILSHAMASDVRGAHVFGVLPLYLASEAERVTVIPLIGIPEHLRGTELNLEDVRKYAGKPITYSVCRLKDVHPSDLDAMETSRAYGWSKRKPGGF